MRLINSNIVFNSYDQLEIDHLSSKVENLRWLGKKLKTIETPKFLFAADVDTNVWLNLVDSKNSKICGGGIGTPDAHSNMQWVNSDCDQYNTWFKGNIKHHGERKFDFQFELNDQIGFAECKATNIYRSIRSYFNADHFKPLNKIDYISLSSFVVRTNWNESERDHILEELTRTSKELLILDTDNFALKNLSRLIDTHIQSYNKTCEEEHLLAAAIAFHEFKRNTYSREKELSTQLRYIVKKRFCKVKRDLRQCYRLLIRFLFKNMDADTDSEILFNQNLKRNFSIIKKYLTHDKSRNSHLFKYAY